MDQLIVGVLGGGYADTDTYESARALGEAIAREGWVLLNGGRDAGVMAASARGANKAGGTVIGVLPGHSRDGASPDLTFAIMTGMGDGRNLINVLTSDVVIAMPGGAGTASEVALAMKNNKPVVLFGFGVGAWADRFRAAGKAIDANTVDEAVAAVKSLLV